MEPSRLKPQGNGWDLIAVTPDYTAFQKGSYCALSSVAFVSDEHLPPHWEWLISFSNQGQQRLNNTQIRQCLAAFQAEDFEEDNHEKGIARKFWKAVDEKYRQPCPCKDETIIAEGDYKYSIISGVK